MLKWKSSWEEGINKFKKWADRALKEWRSEGWEAKNYWKKKERNEWLKLATEGNRNK